MFLLLCAFVLLSSDHVISGRYPNRRAERDSQIDFIIVGGGTAGCVVASRLSESGKYTVLLLEAGSEPDPQLDIPAISVSKIFGELSNLTEVYDSVPQKNAGLTDNGIIKYIHGKTMGGSSSVNFMFWNRGSPYGYDEWANITGDDSWNYANMMKYFQKSEDYNGDFPHDQHGTGGPITISRPRYAPGLDVWLSAGKSLGYPVADPNGPQKISFTPVDFNKRSGRRVSSYTGYIKPFEKTRKNLRIIRNAEVTRIQFQQNRALGVWFTTKSPSTKTESGGVTTRFISARKEVILSAGVIGTPLLLLKSGVGRRFDLDSANIPQVKSLPVGNALQDHPRVKLDFIINNKALAMDLERDLTPETLEYYNKFGDGPYASSVGASGQAFLASSYAEPKNWSDIHLLFESSRGLLSQSVPGTNALAPWETVISCTVVVSRPKSRGSLKLNPENVDKSPLLDFQFYSHPQDESVMLEGIKQVLNLFEKTREYRNLGARLLPNADAIACRLFQFRSDKYWKCIIKQVSKSNFHAGGSCKMGRGEEDAEAVVDSNLKVIGMSGLRIVDGSVMPTLQNCNWQAVMFAIAEKASDRILSEWE